MLRGRGRIGKDRVRRKVLFGLESFCRPFQKKWMGRRLQATAILKRPHRSRCRRSKKFVSYGTMKSARRRVGFWSGSRRERIEMVSEELFVGRGHGGDCDHWKG